jgi:hypothetical protein
VSYLTILTLERSLRQKLYKAVTGGNEADKLEKHRLDVEVNRRYTVQKMVAITGVVLSMLLFSLSVTGCAKGQGNLETRVAALESDLASLEDQVEILGSREVSFQTGIISKASRAEPTNDAWTALTAPDGSKIFKVIFDRAFLEVPKVILSPVLLEDYSRNAGTFYAVRMSQQNVSATGFTFTVDGAYSESFSNLEIQWFAAGYINQ